MLLFHWDSPCSKKDETHSSSLRYQVANDATTFWWSHREEANWNLTIRPFLPIWWNLSQEMEREININDRIQGDMKANSYRWCPKKEYCLLNLLVLDCSLVLSGAEVNAKRRQRNLKCFFKKSLKTKAKLSEFDETNPIWTFANAFNLDHARKLYEEIQI